MNNSIEKITAQCIQLHDQKRFPATDMIGLRSSMRLQSWIERETRDLVISIHAHVAAVPKEHLRIQRRWPKTWWDAFKERWFPTWVLRRWPAEHEEINIDRIVSWSVCPHVETPENASHVSWLLNQGKIPVKEIHDG